MIEYKKYLQGLYNAVDGIADKVYVADRPKAVADKTKSFIIVDLPSYVSNRELNRDGSFNYYVTTATIDLFVRDKLTAQRVEMLDINKMDELLKKLLEVFPIKDKEHSIFVYNPRVILSASDGEGFHYTSIQARLTTYL